MASAYIRNCYNRKTRKTPYESFTGSKPNLNKMHILGTTSFCYVQNKTNLYPLYEKGIFVGYDKRSPAYLIYFQESTAIKRVWCVKFADLYNNSPQMKQEDEHIELSDYISNTYDEKLKGNFNSEGEGKIKRYPTRQRRKSVFLSLKTLNLVEMITVVYNTYNSH